MNRTALVLAFLLALCLVTPAHAGPAAPAPTLTQTFAAPAATACSAAEVIDFETIARPQLLCQHCPVQQGETCSYVGQECGLGSGCSCKTLGSTLACCV